MKLLLFTEFFEGICNLFISAIKRKVHIVFGINISDYLYTRILINTIELQSFLYIPMILFLNIQGRDNRRKQPIISHRRIPSPKGSTGCQPEHICSLPSRRRKCPFSSSRSRDYVYHHIQPKLFV